MSGGQILSLGFLGLICLVGAWGYIDDRRRRRARIWALVAGKQEAREARQIVQDRAARPFRAEEERMSASYTPIVVDPVDKDLVEVENEIDAQLELVPAKDILEQVAIRATLLVAKATIVAARARHSDAQDLGNALFEIKSAIEDIDC